jgi:hypothetical protein
VDVLATGSGVTRFTVTCEGRIVDDDEAVLDRETLIGIMDEIMEQLDALTGIQDPDASAEFPTGQVRLAVDVVADAPDEAYLAGSRAIRAALHAAMIATPGWEDREYQRLAQVRASIETDEVSIRAQRELQDA